MQRCQNNFCSNYNVTEKKNNWLTYRLY